jgi:tetratricopeptide (TPR) repeat protein
MKLWISAVALSILFWLNTDFAHAAPAHSVKGIVITPDGTVIPAFAVTVKRVTDKPQLVQRNHFKKGEFTLTGLQSGKYQVQIAAPLYIPFRMDLSFKADDKETQYSIVVLHAYRNEPRFMPAYAVSVKALQQKIPDSARDAYLRAVKLHREGELQQALVEYGAAIRAYPQYIQALSDLSTIFILFNMPDSALAFLRRAQDIDDTNPIVNLNVAIAMTEQGEYSGAMKLLRKVLKVDPRLSLAQYYIAKIHYTQRKYPEAELAARQAVDIDPNLLEAWTLLIRVKQELNDLPGAREALSHLREVLSDKTIAKFLDEQLSTLDAAGS